MENNECKKYVSTGSLNFIIAVRSDRGCPGPLATPLNPRLNVPILIITGTGIVVFLLTTLFSCKKNGNFFPLSFVLGDPVKREKLYNILLEFGSPKKSVRRIPMCLNGTISRVLLKFIMG